MNHSLKNPVAHRRLARGANASSKVRGFSRLYQRGTEFKARQLWLDFQDAVGPALEAIAESVDKSRAWFKAWVRGFMTKDLIHGDSSQQLQLKFGCEIKTL